MLGGPAVTRLWVSSSSPSPDELAALKRLAINEAWRRGDLRYKLHDTQLAIHAAIAAHTGRRFYVCCSRRLGKSHLLLTMAFEQALRTPNSRVLYLAPWSKDAAEIATDLAVTIASDAPDDYRPEYRAQSREFAFRNGSLIRLKGTNGEHAQYLRGGATHLVILDECGLMDDLLHVANEVVMPMTMTTRGRMIFATTPARTPGHESKQLYDECAREGALSEFTLLDAPETHITQDDKAVYLRAAGEAEADIPDILARKKFPKSNTAQREYFCRWVTEAGLAVVPEFTPEAKAEIVRKHPTPPFRDLYVAMDPGMKDKTGILFGYWDFVAHRLVIEDELVLSQAITPEIARAIYQKETQLWHGAAPYLRIADIELRLIADLHRLHGLSFAAADKRDSESAIAEMRRFVQQRLIVIDPRCTTLIRQLENATWNKKLTDMERDRSPQQLDGHYDLVAALKYLVRHINHVRNPYPDHYHEPSRDVWVSPKRAKKPDYGLRVNTPVARKLQKRGR